MYDEGIFSFAGDQGFCLRQKPWKVIDSKRGEVRGGDRGGKGKGKFFHSHSNLLRQKVIWCSQEVLHCVLEEGKGVIGYKIPEVLWSFCKLKVSISIFWEGPRGGGRGA